LILFQPALLRSASLRKQSKNGNHKPSRWDWVTFVVDYSYCTTQEVSIEITLCFYVVLWHRRRGGIDVDLPFPYPPLMASTKKSSSPSFRALVISSTKIFCPLTKNHTWGLRLPCLSYSHRLIFGNRASNSWRHSIGLFPVTFTNSCPSVNLRNSEDIFMVTLIYRP
jgi:hypothetical protein